MRPFIPKPLRYEPKHGLVVLSHFGGCAEDAEERGRVEDVDPFVPLQIENIPSVGTPYAGGSLNDGTERYAGDVSPFVVVHIVPTDIRIIQWALASLRNVRDDNGEKHGEVKKRVQASNEHESDIFAVCDIPIARQELVHLFSMSQERTKRQSWVIKSSQIAAIVTMRRLTSKNDAQHTGYDRGGVADYIAHIAVDIGCASLFLHNFKPRRLCNYDYSQELVT